MTRFRRFDSRIALAAILVLAAVLRLVGVRYGLPLAVLNPDESSIVPRAWRMGHGHLDPGWYDYPSLLMGLLAPVQAFFGAPALGAARLVAVAPRARWGRRHVVARPACLRHRRGDRRRRGRRGRDDARRLLADGGHRRAPDARDHVRARARRRGADRVGRARGRPRGIREVPRVRSPPCRSSSPGGGDGAPLGRAARARDRRLRPDEPVRADPRRRGLGRHLARATSRARRAGWGSRTTRSPRSRTLDRLWEAIGPLLLVAAVGLVAALVRRTPRGPRAALVRGRPTG